MAYSESDSSRFYELYKYVGIEYLRYIDEPYNSSDSEGDKENIPVKIEPLNTEKITQVVKELYHDFFENEDFAFPSWYSLVRFEEFGTAIQDAVQKIGKGYYIFTIEVLIYRPGEEPEDWDPNQNVNSKILVSYESERMKGIVNIGYITGSELLL